MEKLSSDHEGKLDQEGKSEDGLEPEAEGKAAEEENPKVEGKAAREGQQEGGGEPEEEGHPRDEDKSGKQGKSSEEEPQATTASESRAAEKRPAEDYVPRKAKRKTDRGTDDSPKDSRGDLQDRHLSSEEMMRECADMSRAQEELRKKQKMGGCHWMQRDAQDAFAPRGQRGVRGMRGGGRGHRGLHNVHYL
ncbi:transcription elongation factor A protein-like 6 isoform 1-T4 [Thomomys bottae]